MKKDGAATTDQEKNAALAEAEAMPPAVAPFATPRRYTLADLEEDKRRVLVSVADLPLGHGLGEVAEEKLGGGLLAGDMVAFGAAKAGAGKTAFLLQLADGLALRSAHLAASGGQEPLTPVLLLSELSPMALAHRTLARLCGAPVNYFRSGAAAARYNDRGRVADAYQNAAEHLEPGGTFGLLAAWQRLARPQSSGRDMLAELTNTVNAWRDELAARYRRPVWPVVAVDPIQRWQPHDLGEVEALNQLSEDLDQQADANGWIVLLTSDTNKASAAPREDDKNSGTLGAGVFRGSYKLIHSCEVVGVLNAEDYAGPDKSRVVDVFFEKNRNGPAGFEVRYFWNSATGHFKPESRADNKDRRDKTPAAKPHKTKPANSLEGIPL